MVHTNSLSTSDICRPVIECYTKLNSVYIRFIEDVSGRKFRVSYQGQIVAEAICSLPNDEICVDLPWFPWSPAEPNLFIIEILGNKSQKNHSEYFGFRSLSTTQDHILLNGHTFYVRGFIRGIKAHDHANLTNLTNMDFYEQQVRIAKDLGFNLVRWHSTIPPQEWLIACDHLGLFNQIEFAPKHKWGGGHEITIDLEFVKNTICTTSFHPSVFAYSLGNEIHKSGGNSTVREALSLIRHESPHTLVLDSSGWGEFDREGNDLIVQHIAYFFPFGIHRDMFHTRDCFDINGSVRIAKTPKELASKKGEAILAKRHLQPVKPVVAHEILHMIGLPDLKKLRQKFENHHVQLPKWLFAAEELVRNKGMWEDFEDLRLAAAYFKSICIKEALERLRMSSMLAGYQMLQLFDTERYENSNGILDCFDEERDRVPEIIRAVNGDVALLADLPTKCFFLSDSVQVLLLLSQFAVGMQYADLEVKFSITDEKSEPTKHSLSDLFIARVGVYPLVTLDLINDPIEKPVQKSLCAKLTADGQVVTENDWSIWIFPHSHISYGELRSQTGVINKLDVATLQRLERGDTLLFLYDPDVPLEETGLPLVRDHFKPVIWDRGSQLGGRIGKHPLTDKFPHTGNIDFQFARLIEGGTKVNLDGLRVIKPLIQGIDKLARDRMDVLKRNKPDFQPETTFRRFGYLFEMLVGEGRLLVCTFNLSEANLLHPEVAWFARQLVDYFRSAEFQPVECIPYDQMCEWVINAPALVNIEPVMNIFWEEDDQPVESVLWWEKVGIDITS